MRSTYEHAIDDVGTIATWTRGGREWTIEEWQNLVRRLSEMWEDHFGKIEEAMLPESI